MDKPLIESLRHRIDRAEVVSFDVFDTLLSRPYLHPADLFVHMGCALRKPQFAARRVEAERSARRAHPELADVTLGMIYAELEPEYAPLQQQEMEWEARVLRADPEVQQVYAYARAQGKRIAIVSDMYMPAEWLAATLRQNGYEGWERLYVSCEAGACKHDGALFRHLLADFAVQPGAVLHIGDRERADVVAPRRLGIGAVRYAPAWRRFLAGHRAIAACADKGRQGLAFSIMVGLLSYDWQLRRCGLRPAASYWHELGYRYAGPVGYGYTRFVEKAAQQAGAGALLFVARDGYLLQKIYAEFGARLPSAYVYAPRFLNHICRLDYVPSRPDQARSIISFFAGQDAELAAAAQAEPATPPQVFIQQRRARFAALAARQLGQYRRYLRARVPAASSYALVDSITAEFSSQKIVQDALQHEVTGIYWGLCDTAPEAAFAWAAFAGKQQNPLVEERARVFTRCWSLMEFFLSSPEHPVLHVAEDGAPVHAPRQSAYELRRASLFPELAEGALQFVRDAQARFGGQEVFLDAPTLIRWVNAYVDHPTARDRQHMSPIRCALDTAHATWVPLLAADVGVGQFLRSPRRAARLLKLARWRSPLQTLLLCLAKPLTLHLRGMRRITLALFPHLRRRLFALSLSPGFRSHFQFIIGNINA